MVLSPLTLLCSQHCRASPKLFLLPKVKLCTHYTLTLCSSLSQSLAATLPSVPLVLAGASCKMHQQYLSFRVMSSGFVNVRAGARMSSLSLSTHPFYAHTAFSTSVDPAFLSLGCCEHACTSQFQSPRFHFCG